MHTCTHAHQHCSTQTRMNHFSLPMDWLINISINKLFVFVIRLYAQNSSIARLRQIQLNVMKRIGCTWMLRYGCSHFDKKKQIWKEIFLRWLDRLNEKVNERQREKNKMRKSKRAKKEGNETEEETNKKDWVRERLYKAMKTERPRTHAIYDAWNWATKWNGNINISVVGTRKYTIIASEYYTSQPVNIIRMHSNIPMWKNNIVPLLWAVGFFIFIK